VNEPTQSETGSQGTDDHRSAVALADRVRDVVLPIARALRLDVVEVACVGRGAGMQVRVFIEKAGGVTLRDCEQLHQSVGHALDIADPIPHAYTLEVSSPGVNRPLTTQADFSRHLGYAVSVKLRAPLEGEWRVRGRLAAVTEEGLVVEVPRGKVPARVPLTWAEIVDGRREVEFTRRPSSARA
jgi:ribosome maturation factor RimP